MSNSPSIRRATCGFFKPDLYHRSLARHSESGPDNARCVEYRRVLPGSSLPLTATFAPRAYDGVFTSLARRLTSNPALVEQMTPVLSQMVVACSGRLFYRLDHWHRVLTLMPLGRRYVKIWQKALGMPSERLTVAAPLGPVGRLAVAGRLLRELRRTPHLMQGLHSEVEALRADLDIDGASTLEALRDAYDLVETRVLQHWDITLLNDVHAFVWPALLEGWLRVTGRGRQATPLLAGVAGIESLRPVVALAALAADAPDLSHLRTDKDVRSFLATDDPYATRLRAYLDDLGDRGLEELKLESPTFRTHPLTLIDAVRTHPLHDLARPQPQPEPAGIAGRLVGRARQAIGNRESSRLDRARIYGMVRQIAIRAGELQAAAGNLAAADDVWWLTFGELFMTADHRAIVEERRADYAGYSTLPSYRRRVFAGEPFDVHPAPDARPLGSIRTDDRAHSDDSRRGTGVSHGRVTGRARIVHNPREPFEPGEILVASTTDPGWVFLLMNAGAVVVERGSLLSHTAIVARELGVPVVVGIDDATTWLRDGDAVTVDGTRGSVRILTEVAA